MGFYLYYVEMEADYNTKKNPQNAANHRTFHRGVRRRLLTDPGWINWNRLGKAERHNWLTTYRLGRHGNRFIETAADPFAEPVSLPKSQPKVGMSCEKCKKLGKTCTGTAPNLCPQCGVAGFKQGECVYLDDALKLTVPAWYTRGAAPIGGVGGGGGGGGGGGSVAGGGGSVASGADAPIQLAIPNRGGAGLAIRKPGRGSPTGFENEVLNNNNGVFSNASRDPNATEEEVAAGRAKRQSRRNKVADALEASRLNNMAAGPNSARAVNEIAAGAGGGGGGGRKSRKQKRKNQKRKQKLTRKQK